ncbi:MAG: hypothetical protein JWN30_302 [Bacilli bacterium]|nr:hypothetical protein [Bacilli bacterium]
MPSLRIDGTSVYYEMTGSGRTLVFIHGLFMNQSIWRHVTAHLRDDYQVVTYDLRGHGGTNGDQEEQLSVWTLVEDLRLFLLSKRIENPVIIGYSVGAAVALIYAIRYPNDLSAIVCCGAFAHDPTKYMRSQRLLATLAARFGLKGLLANVIAREFASTSTEYRLFVHLIKHCNLGACVHILNSLDQYDIRDELHNIQVPVLLIYGRGEQEQFQSASNDIMKRVPICTKVVIDGVRRPVMTKKSKEFVLYLQEFLTAHSNNSS